jgi:hypothetical protein
MPKPMVLVRWSPDRERESAARPEHTQRFGDCSFRLREVQQAEIHDHGVEAVGVEVQAFSVPLHHIQVREAASRLRDHSR